MKLPFEVYRMMSPDGEQIIITATRLPKTYTNVYAVQNTYLMECNEENMFYTQYGGIVKEDEFIEGMVVVEINNL